jgi:glycosyltransferase involved in cell wall biosynthesis
MRCGCAAVPTEPNRIAVGIWIELPDYADWNHQGVPRVIGFLIEGAALRGDIVWRVVAPSALRAQIAADFRALAAREGHDWTLHCPPPEAPPDKCEPVVDATPGRSGPVAGESLTPTQIIDESRDRTRLSPRRVGQILFVAGLAALPLLVLRAALRPLLRPITTRLRLIVHMARDPVAVAPGLADAAARLPFGIGNKAAHSLRAWALAASVPPSVAVSIAASAPQVITPPADPLTPTPQFRMLARFANAEVSVHGWLIPFPNFIGSRLLTGPRAVLFPDAIPFLFPLGWRNDFAYPDSNLSLWRSASRHTLEDASNIITFSEHVRDVHGPQFFPPGVPVVVAPPAPPDLSPLLPELSAAATSHGSSRKAAASLLRRHAAERAWLYLADFPFEEATYIAVSTQDRPTKNVQLIVAALARLVRRRFVNCKILMTTPLWRNASWRTDLPQTISDAGLDLDVISMTELPRDVHAALYHCAALAVHASFFEGIVGTLPFFEAVSVGTPCLMANGPHVRELLRHHALADTVFDPFDADDLADLIVRALARRSALLASQSAFLATLRRRDWSAVAAEYATAATGHAFPVMRSSAA